MKSPKSRFFVWGSMLFTYTVCEYLYIPFRIRFILISKVRWQEWAELYFLYFIWSFIP